MDASIVVAIISGIATVLAVVITNASSNKKVVSQLKENQAVLETKYTERLKIIERETAQIPAIKQDVHNLQTGFAVHEEQIKTITKMVGGIK